MGRKRLEIDEDKVYKLASMGLNHKEIGEVLGCCSKTLQRNFVHLIENGHDNMRASLTRMQFMQAMGSRAEYDAKGNKVKAECKPNITMLIWLGKQKLGQSDRLVREDHTPGGAEMREAKDRVAKIMADDEARKLYNKLCDRLGAMDGQAAPLVRGGVGGNGKGRAGGNGEDTED